MVLTSLLFLRSLRSIVMTDLSLVSFDDIWEELKNRYEVVVVLTIKNIDRNREARSMNSAGGRYSCLGLVAYAQDRILYDIERDDTDDATYEP